MRPQVADRVTHGVAAGQRGWRRLASRGAAPLIVVVLAGVVGFLLVGQVRGDRPAPTPLSAEREGDLARILANLNAEATALQTEVAELRVQLNELRRASEDEVAAAQVAAEQLRTLRVLAGTVPVTGPGVTVRIADPERSVTYDAIIDVVQELRDAGAEAVAVNGLRIGATTAFAELDGKVAVDGSALTPPYRIQAIGQAATLDGGLKIPGGAVDTLATLKGVKVTVERQARLDLPALAVPPAFEVARPVPASP